MDHKRQHMFARVPAGAQHRDPDRPFTVQLEAVPTLGVKLFGQPGCTVLAGAIEGRAADRQITGRIDHLVGDAVDFDVAGAQDFVAGDDVADRGDQCLDVPWPAQLCGEGNVVDPTGAVYAIREPAA